MSGISGMNPILLLKSSIVQQLILPSSSSSTDQSTLQNKNIRYYLSNEYPNKHNPYCQKIFKVCLLTLQNYCMRWSKMLPLMEYHQHVDYSSQQKLLLPLSLHSKVFSSSILERGYTICHHFPKWKWECFHFSY